MILDWTLDNNAFIPAFHMSQFESVPTILLCFSTYFRKIPSSSTVTWILLLPEKHYLHHKCSCPRHHLEPDFDSPCAWIWGLWAWGVPAVVPGLFGSCHIKPPSWQLEGDPQGHHLWILHSNVRDICQQKEGIFGVSVMVNYTSSKVAIITLFFSSA